MFDITWIPAAGILQRGNWEQDTSGRLQDYLINCDHCLSLLPVKVIVIPGLEVGLGPFLEIKPQINPT